MIRYILFLGLISLISCSQIHGQSVDEKYAKDVKSIDAIINAYYDVISGSSNDPWEFERDKFIHSENAVIIYINENGHVKTYSLEAIYIPFLLSPRGNLYEVELNRIVNRFGTLAQVWSTYEIRTDPKIPTGMRGINSVQLYFSENRWWISGWTTQLESGDNPIPAKYLNNE